ncbi:MAG: efflux RND transporter permease subunit, partial [Geminicoccaceae bacterium]
MSIASVAIDKKKVTYFAAFLVVVAGLASFFSLGQLEDPEFTVKSALIVTTYPGAGPKEVELEVTDRIETALQELKQLDYVKSFSRAGLSYIQVEIQPTYGSDVLPQIWDEMRRKIRKVEDDLPPGAGRPAINDDFGDVFGFQLALVSDGYSFADLERFAKSLRKELGLVEGVARVDLWGVQRKAIYLTVREGPFTQLGLSEESIEQTLQQQNLVVEAGGLDLMSKRYRIAPTGEFSSPSDIGNLVLRPTVLDVVQDRERVPAAVTRPELIRINDIGEVNLGYIDPPQQLMRFNGRPAIGISITNVPGVNIVDVGRNIDERLAVLGEQLPIGIEIEHMHWMSEAVSDAVDNFIISFAEAVGIVLVVLALAMGWRMGLIIGSSLIITILGSFILMSMFGIDLQRMSLGALVIALGMMVDNAIVVADGVSVRLEQGMDRRKAALEAAMQPSGPLLGATVIAVMAFYPIFASPESAGEYCATLFSVVAISLLFSWVVAITLTPVQCIDLLKVDKSSGDDPYGSGLYQRFRGMLAKAIRMRWLTLGAMVGLLAMAFVGFGNVSKLFFPSSSMSKFMIDYFAPEGTRIQDVAGQLQALEQRLLEDERVENVTAFVGSGPPRFYLPVEPEEINSSYGQLIVNVRDFREIKPLVTDLRPWISENLPNALVPVREYGVGPANTWKFELRLSGPADADPDTLRSLAQRYVDVLEDEPMTAYARTDWRQRVQKVVPVYNEERGRWAGVTRNDIAKTTKRAFDGRPVGLYREDDDLIPILLRHDEEERRNISNVPQLQVQPERSTRPVPLAQVTDAIVTEWEDPVIRRRDRRRTIAVQANPIPGVTLPTMREAVLEKVEAVELPPGYSWEWGGEWENTVDSQSSLLPGVIPAVVIMLFILVYLFNAFLPPLIIVATIPFAFIGITAGLLTFDISFGFMALLGTMSLAGMMVKNAIVLLDQADIEVAAGKERYDAIMSAAVSRLRPVLLAAATTVLGVVPLIQDVFWIGLAVTIMAGLTFGTILTMIMVPVLYATFY